MLMLQEVNPMEPNIYLYLEQQVNVDPSNVAFPIAHSASPGPAVTYPHPLPAPL